MSLNEPNGCDLRLMHVPACVSPGVQCLRLSLQFATKNTQVVNASGARNLSSVQTQEKRDSSARSRPRNDNVLRLSATCLVWVRMAPIPVMGLFSPTGPREFVGLSVIIAQVYSPGMVLMIIPVVIILVAGIIDSNLNAVAVRSGGGHNCHRCRDGNGKD